MRALLGRPPGRATGSHQGALSSEQASRVGTSEVGEEDVKYRIYVETILRTLRLDWLRFAKETRGLSGRAALEQAICIFISQLRGLVRSCDDRKLSKASLRRAHGIESELSVLSDSILAQLMRAGELAADDLHAVWRGFTEVRGWRDARVPQESLLQMLRGALAELDDAEASRWREQALSVELVLPEVHLAIPAGAWPSLCEILGRLPDCVTVVELRETLWQQCFVENPTHAPDYRNYRRFANLAAQMVTIGVELESEKVELLVQQTLALNRPWRERRDMLSGILSAASVEDRCAVVRSLDQRFEECGDLDDFEIVCGIAEYVGVEIPREGAIRRCALRRWALDPRRGGVLPVARLIDFVDADAAIGEDVAASLRQRGRVAEAALLLARLPRPLSESPLPAGGLDINNGDAELERLRELLALDDGGADSDSMGGVFGPVEEGAARLPLPCSDQVGYHCTASAAVEALKQLQGSRLLAVGFWREEAPFWHAPVTLLALCTEDRAELFDLLALRTDGSGGWPEAANLIRDLLSDPQCLKVGFGDDDILITFASSLFLGIAHTLQRGARESLGPYLDLRSLVSSMVCCSPDAPGNVWHAVARRFLGVRLCLEEAGSNWSRRPLRASQLHHAALECWTLLPLLRAFFAHGIVSPKDARQHLLVQVQARAGGRGRSARTHALGQLAPPGRLAWTESAEAGLLQQMSDLAETPGSSSREHAQPLRIARLAVAAADAKGPSGITLPAGALVAVFEERFGGFATIAALGEPADQAMLRVPSSSLHATNCWECASWVASLPRPHDGAAAKDDAEQAVQARQLTTAAQLDLAEREILVVELIQGLSDAKAAKDLLRQFYEAQ